MLPQLNIPYRSHVHIPQGASKSKLRNQVCVITSTNTNRHSIFFAGTLSGKNLSIDSELVREGCILAPALFSVTIDWTLGLPAVATCRHLQYLACWTMGMWLYQLIYRTHCRARFTLWLQLRFDCDTTTTKNWHVNLLLASNGNRRARYVEVGS